MLRRLTYILAAAAVTLDIAAGVAGGYPAIAAQISQPPDTIPPSIVAPDSARSIFGPMTEKSAVISDRNEDGYADSATEPLAKGEVETNGWDLKATKGV
jgi:hypothetical protein